MRYIKSNIKKKSQKRDLKYDLGQALLENLYKKNCALWEEIYIVHGGLNISQD